MSKSVKSYGLLIIVILLFPFAVRGQSLPVVRPLCVFCGVDLCAGEQHKEKCPFLDPEKYAEAEANNNGKKKGASLKSVNAVHNISGNLEVQKLDNIVSGYLKYLYARLVNKRYTPGTKLINEEECHDDGFVVVCGYDGYYSIWNENAGHYQFADPKGSILTQMILYNARAVCVQFWLHKKWGLFDLCHKGKTASPFTAKVLTENFEYDDVRCVAKDAPIAVGKFKNRKCNWGLFTRSPGTDTWSHTVENTWTDIKILPLGKRSFAIARDEDNVALYDEYGRLVTNNMYARILPFVRIDDMPYFLVESDGKFGIMACNGTLAVDCIYGDMKIDADGIKGLLGDEWVPVK